MPAEHSKAHKPDPQLWLKVSWALFQVNNIFCPDTVLGNIFYQFQLLESSHCPVQHLYNQCSIFHFSARCYSTGFRGKMGTCHLMQRRSVQTMKYSKTKVCKDPSNSSLAAWCTRRGEMESIHSSGNMLLVEPVQLQSAVWRKGHVPKPWKQGKACCFLGREGDHSLILLQWRGIFTFLLWTD